MLSSIVNTLLNGGIVVMRTDTVYGVLASASSQKAVEKVYTVKNRATDKQCILLITNPRSMSAHSEIVTSHTNASERPTSIVIPVSDEPSWVTRGGTDIAYRVVRRGLLKEVIEAVGPLLAPSANPEGLPPAHNIEEARQYFGDSVDLYVDGGQVPPEVAPSNLVRINSDGSVDQLR